MLKYPLRVLNKEAFMINFLIVLISIILDQLTKYLAVTHLKAIPSRTIPLIPGVFHFTYVENTGAAFSIFQDKRLFFIVVTIIAAIIIIYYMITMKSEGRLFQTSLAMILGGAIGNLIDRVLHGYVVDFFDFRAINFAIFNVADCFVTIGSIFLFYYIIFIYGKKHNIN